MTTAMDKAKVSAITGAFGSLTAFVAGYTNFVMIAGMAAFLFTMMIQYGLIKVKILVPAATALGLISWYLYSYGVDALSALTKILFPN